MADDLENLLLVSMRRRVARRAKPLSGFKQYRLTMDTCSDSWRQEALNFQLDKLTHCGIQIAFVDVHAWTNFFNRLVTEGILANHCGACSIDNNVLVQ
jgi:hypothetical protein